MRAIRLTFAALLALGLVGCGNGLTLPDQSERQPAYDDGGVFTTGGGAALAQPGAPHPDGVFTTGSGNRTEGTSGGTTTPAGSTTDPAAQ
jgi:hypothetical protein